MSLNKNALEVVKVIPPPLEIDKKPYKVDGTYRTHKMIRLNPTSSGDVSGGVEFAYTPTSGVGLGRRAYLQADFWITFDCTNASDAVKPPFPEDQNAPRSYPMNRAIKTQEVSINGTPFQLSNGQIMDVIDHCLPQECHKINCLDSVFRRDNFTNYGAATGASNNPIRSYKDGTFESPSRGAGYYNLLEMDNTGIPAAAEGVPGAGQRLVKVQFTEAVLCQPFCFDEVDEQPALFGLRRLNVSINWSPVMANALWSRIEGQNDAKATISNVQIFNPHLLIEQFSPHAGFPIPKQLQYDYFDMKAVSSGQGQINAGERKTLSNTITLGATCPTRIFVFARRNPDTLSMLEGNTFLKITGANCTFNASDTILGEATPQQLWDLSRVNGLYQEYEEWSGRKIGNGALSGGMLLINPARDLSLPMDRTNGTLGPDQFTINLEV